MCEPLTVNQNGGGSEISRTVWADKSAPGGSGSLAVWDPMTDDYKSAAFNSYKEPSTQELARCIPGDVSASSPLSSNQSEEDVRLFIKGIPLEMTQTGLKNLFSQAGEVVYCKIVPSTNSSFNTRIGFVGYKTVREAECGIQKLDGFDLGQGIRLRVSLSVAKPVHEKRGCHYGVVNGSSSVSPANDKSGTSQEKADNNTEQMPSKTSDQSVAGLTTAPGDIVKTGLAPQIVLKPCSLCTKMGSKWCSACKTPYCSPKCQRQDWPQHKKTCVKDSTTKQTAVAAGTTPGTTAEVQKLQTQEVGAERDEKELPGACEAQQTEKSGEAGFVDISEDDVDIGDPDVVAELLGLKSFSGESDEKPLAPTESNEATPHNESHGVRAEGLELADKELSDTGPQGSPTASGGNPIPDSEQSFVPRRGGHSRFYAKELPFVSLPLGNTLDVVVTEVCSLGALWCQLFYPEHIEQQEALRKGLQLAYSESVFENYVPSNGELCVAQFSFDNCWYRVVVDYVANNGMVHVTYIDFGNSDDIKIDRVRQIKEEFANVPRQARKVALFGVTGAETLGECSELGLEFLRSRVLGVKCQATLQSEPGEVTFVDLFDPEGQPLSNALVNRGFAQFVSTGQEQEELTSTSQDSPVQHSELDSQQQQPTYPSLSLGPSSQSFLSPDEDCSYQRNQPFSALVDNRGIPVTQSSQSSVGFVDDQAAFPPDLPGGAPKASVTSPQVKIAAVFSKLPSSIDTTREVPVFSSFHEDAAFPSASSHDAGLPVNAQLPNSQPSSYDEPPVPLPSTGGVTPPFHQTAFPSASSYDAGLPLNAQLPNSQPSSYDETPVPLPDTGNVAPPLHQTAFPSASSHDAGLPLNAQLSNGEPSSYDEPPVPLPSTGSVAPPFHQTSFPSASSHDAGLPLNAQLSNDKPSSYDEPPVPLPSIGSVAPPFHQTSFPSASSHDAGLPLNAQLSNGEPSSYDEPPVPLPDTGSVAPPFHQTAFPSASSHDAGLPVRAQPSSSQPLYSGSLSHNTPPVQPDSPPDGQNSLHHSANIPCVTAPQFNDAPSYTHPTQTSNSYHSPEGSATGPPKVSGPQSYGNSSPLSASPQRPERQVPKSPPVNGNNFASHRQSTSPRSPPGEGPVNKGGRDSVKRVSPSNSRRQILPNMTPFKGIVNSVLSPWTFFVQKTEPDFVRKLNTLVAALNQYMRSISGEPSALNRPQEMCAAQFSQDNVWYRAEVLQILQDGRVHVRFIDFGNSEVMPLSRVRNLPVRFQSLPRFSVMCSLSGVRKPKECQEWSREAISYLKSLVTQREFLCKPTYVHGDVWLVELLDGRGRAAVANEMIAKGFADRFVPAGSDSSLVEVVFKPAIESADLPGPRQMFDIILTDIVSPGRMYAQIAKIAPLLVELAQDMNSHYHPTKPCQLEIKEGQLYAALFSATGDWCRAIVKSSLPNGSCSVLYVDFGNTEELEGFKLRPLEKRFLALPFCTLRCSLAHLTPVDTKQWSDEAIAFIKSSLPLFKRFSAKLVAQGKGVLFLDIIEPSGKESFSQVMINNNLAKRFVKEGRDEKGRGGHF